jgi:hypothetical protein
LVTDYDEPTFTVDGEGNKVWEKNCIEEFAMVLEDWVEQPTGHRRPAQHPCTPPRPGDRNH